MSKINSQRLSLESFKEQQTWIAPLLNTLNQFFGDVISAFNNNLSVEDNLFAEIKELTFINSTGNFPLKFQTKFKANPKGMIVIYCYDSTNSEMNFSSPPWANWIYSNGEIQINSITGLTSGRSYILRVRIDYK